MELIADGVLILAATVAGLYCLVLSRRLRSLSQMEGGLGKAITSMSGQVDEMKEALSNAKLSTEESASMLRIQTEAAGKAADNLARLLEAETVVRTSHAELKSEADSRQVPDKLSVVTELRGKSLRKTAGEDEATSSRRIDSLISSYLNEFDGEDEAVIARRLVTALTATNPSNSERAV